MHVSYGSPGHKGVTHLMAVGASELEDGPTDRVVRIGLLGAAAAMLFGLVSGNRPVLNVGLGGALALIAVRQASGRHNKVVQITV